MKFLILLFLFTSLVFGDWIFGPEDFERGTMPADWFAPTYHTPMYVYAPGFESGYAVGSGPMTWPDWWGNFVRTPLVDCSSADSVILTFRMYNTGISGDYARFYIWVEPTGYLGTVTYDMDSVRDWELVNVDFTADAAGQSQVYFYLEPNFGSDSYTHEAKFDDVGVCTNTILSIDENQKLPNRNEIIVYPNPVSDILTYKCDSFVKQISLYDIRGNIVAASLGNSGQISVKNLPIGIYIIETGTGISTKVMVK